MYDAYLYLLSKRSGIKPGSGAIDRGETGNDEFH